MSAEFHVPEKWWVSPFNLVPEVRNTFSLPPRVEIHDATLRDGEQTPGVVFSVADKVAIAEKLAEIGVDRIEAGMPASMRSTPISASFSAMATLSATLKTTPGVCSPSRRVASWI